MSFFDKIICQYYKFVDFSLFDYFIRFYVFCIWFSISITWLYMASLANLMVSRVFFHWPEYEIPSIFIYHHVGKLQVHTCQSPSWFIQYLEQWFSIFYSGYQFWVLSFQLRCYILRFTTRLKGPLFISHLIFATSLKLL